jgi:hypothetical protein
MRAHGGRRILGARAAVTSRRRLDKKRLVGKRPFGVVNHVTAPAERRPEAVGAFGKCHKPTIWVAVAEKGNYAAANTAATVTVANLQ